MAERILIVDDDQGMREGLTMLLDTLGYRVLAVPDGAAALAALQTDPPDVLLLDLILPGDMNGIQLLQTARQVAPHVGAIVMTGYPDAETTVEALRLGAFDYVTKPFDLGRMSGLLTQLFARLRQERQSAETLRQLETISHCSRVGLYTVDLAGVFAYWGCAGLLGYVAEEMAGRQTPAAIVLSPGFDLQAELQACHREGSTLREHQVRRKDGVILSVRTKLVSLVDPQRQPAGYAAYLLDVSEERRYQTAHQERILEMEGCLRDQAGLVDVLQRLGESARNGVRLPDLVSLAVTGALRLVPDARFAWCFLRDAGDEGLPAVRVDDAHEVFLAGAAHSTAVLQRSAAALCTAGACDCMRRLTGLEAPMLQPRLVPCSRLELLEARGGDEPACHLAVPLVFRGQVIGLLNVAKAGTGTFAPEETTRLEIVADALALGISAGYWAAETEKAARQLRETQGRTVRTERLRAVGELASGVAHDFNNLLTAILGSAELLSREETDPHRLEELQTIRHAAQDGAETVRRILEYTRVRRNRDLVRVALSNVIREAVELTRGRWRNAVQARGATIDMHLDLDVVRPVMGNPAELREMLTNLILNAVDAMPNGGRLTLGLREIPHGENASVAEIRVEDTGIGMTPEVLEHIFDPFFTTKEGTGAGLGLAVAYGIVDRHQGEMTVHSVPGHGTSFIIRLPVVAVQADGDAVSVPIDAMRPVGTRLAIERSAHTARILVVDDEPKLAQLLQSFLELQGHRASTVTGGAEAMALLGRERFDLLLTDIGMPGMSGWDVAREARRRQPDLPVILVSGWGAQIDPQQVAETGVAEVIQKPYTFETVHEVIEAALRERNTSPLSPA